jgi:hypothetical protein
VIILPKNMPNGVLAIRHKIFKIELSSESYNQYIVSVNSYHTEDTLGPISWQDHYLVISETCISSYKDMEASLVSSTSSPFFGGEID